MLINMLYTWKTRIKLKMRKEQVLKSLKEKIIQNQQKIKNIIQGNQIQLNLKKMKKILSFQK